MKRFGKMSLIFEYSVSKLSYTELFMKILKINFLIQSKYEKIRTRKTPYLDTFRAVSSSFFGWGGGKAVII